jgi:hypothetical protein
MPRQTFCLCRAGRRMSFKEERFRKDNSARPNEHSAYNKQNITDSFHH